MMAAALVNLDIALTDDLRVVPRIGGGFAVLIGPTGRAHSISFSTASAEGFAQLLTLAAVTHGSFGEAPTATERAANVAPFSPQLKA